MDPSSAFLVTLLTFNTGLLSVGGVDVVPRVDERRAQQAQVLDGWAADHPEGILVLQEVWNIPRADVLVKHLEARNWTVWLPPQRAGWGATSGLLLAAGSAYTVLDRGFERFEARLGWEALSAKGTAWFRLRMPGGADFVVLNTHLAAVDTKEGQLVDARQLPLYRSQVEQVKELAIRVSGVTGLWLLAGDFNAGELAAPEAWALWGTDRFPGTDDRPPEHTRARHLGLGQRVGAGGPVPRRRYRRPRPRAVAIVLGCLTGIGPDGLQRFCPSF